MSNLGFTSDDFFINCLFFANKAKSQDEPVTYSKKETPVDQQQSNQKITKSTIVRHL